jgi:hypothetical protein
MLRYAHNSVTIDVHYFDYRNGELPTQSAIDQLMRKRLSAQDGVDLLDMDTAFFDTQNISGVSHHATYMLPPFGKTIHYKISNYTNTNQRWMISARYKACDTKGKQLVNRFMESLSFVNTI